MPFLKEHFPVLPQSIITSKEKSLKSPIYIPISQVVSQMSFFFFLNKKPVPCIVFSYLSLVFFFVLE